MAIGAGTDVAVESARITCFAEGIYTFSSVGARATRGQFPERPVYAQHRFLISYSLKIRTPSN